MEGKRRTVLVPELGVVEKLLDTYVHYAEINPEKAKDMLFRQLGEFLTECTDIHGKTFRNMVRRVNADMGHIISDIQHEVPTIVDDDIKLVVYTAMGFSTTVQALFLDTNIRSVYNRKYRLRRKIESSKFPRAKELIALLFPVNNLRAAGSRP